MKPVVPILCLVFLFISGMASASIEDCPTCSFAYESPTVLASTNPYIGCPTCIFAYESPTVLASTNPYAGCPACIFAYNSSGLLVSGSVSGCPECVFSSTVSDMAAQYRFPNGTAIPEDYVCPVHGTYCPDDPRPVEFRPGYSEPPPEAKPVFTPHVLPKTSAEYLSLFKHPASLPRSERFIVFLNR
ncbi:MAG: hypothetical protein LUQ12_01705 [Methanoregulaceae archaeon]|nr:hypothetical protein [Methanoregulaceae archaeon]